jgi:hypothetical protein
MMLAVLTLDAVLMLVSAAVDKLAAVACPSHL